MYLEKQSVSDTGLPEFHVHDCALANFLLLIHKSYFSNQTGLHKITVYFFLYNVIDISGANAAGKYLQNMTLELYALVGCISITPLSSYEYSIVSAQTACSLYGSYVNELIGGIRLNFGLCRYKKEVRPLSCVTCTESHVNKLRCEAPLLCLVAIF
jgi:hypothetical protein